MVPPSRLRDVYLPAGSTPAAEPIETRETAVAPRFATTSTAWLPARRRYATTWELVAESGTSFPTARASFCLRRWISRRYRFSREPGSASCAATVVVRESGWALSHAVPEVNPSPGRALHCIGVRSRGSGL